MTDDVVIQVNNVSKKFKSQVVLKDITCLLYTSDAADE